MLKRLAVSALILASCWNFEPVPRQTANGGSQSGQNPKQQTDSGKSPAQALPTITVIRKNCDSEAFKNDSDCKAATQKPSPIEISKLPSANVTIDRGPKRDCFDWIIYVGDLLLVIVGIGTLIAVWFQAKRMKEHAEELKKIAAAALLNSQAVISAQRALIMFTIETFSYANKPGQNIFLIRARNFGKTPARNVSISEPMEICTAFHERLKSVPEYGPVKESLEYLVPDDPHTVAQFFPTADGWAGKQIKAAREEQSDPASVRPLIYGEIRYMDGISKEIRISAYCFRFDYGPTPGEIGGQLVPCGPTKYNRAT